MRAKVVDTILMMFIPDNHELHYLRGDQYVIYSFKSVVRALQRFILQFSKKEFHLFVLLYKIDGHINRATVFE